MLSSLELSTVSLGIAELTPLSNCSVSILTVSVLVAFSVDVFNSSLTSKVSPSLTALFSVTPESSRLLSLVIALVVVGILLFVSLVADAFATRLTFSASIGSGCSEGV